MPLDAGFSIDILAPYSGAIESAFEYAMSVRQTMSPANRDRWDDLLLKAFERMDRAIEGLLK